MRPLVCCPISVQGPPRRVPARYQHHQAYQPLRQHQPHRGWPFETSPFFLFFSPPSMTQSTAHVLPSHPPSSSSHPHRRTPSFNPPKVKSARPTLHRRSTTHHSIFKLGSGQPKQSVVQDNSHSEMAASFLNFWYVTSNVISLILPVCLSANTLHSAHSLFLRLTLSCSAMCERQITVPDNSLLYCSERSVFAYKNLSPLRSIC